MPPLTPTRKPANRPRLSQVNLPLPSAMAQNAFRLPQPPGMAHTRPPSRTSPCRLNSTIRAQPQPHRSLFGSPLDYALPRRGPLDPRNSLPAPPQGTRSDDRVRAAQRLFRALGHGPSAQEPEQRPTSRMSLLHGLSVRARRRHEKDAPAEKSDNESDTVECELSLGTISVSVTPPTPPQEDSSTMKGPGMITGVRITSHKLARNAPQMPPSPTLQPPPFELAPGRALMLLERSRNLTPMPALKQVEAQGVHVQTPRAQPRAPVASSQSTSQPQAPRKQLHGLRAPVPVHRSARPGPRTHGPCDKYVPPARRQARVPGTCRVSPGPVRRQLQ